MKKQEKLFDYLISIGFDKLILKDSSSKSVKKDLIIFRHNEFYREALLAFTVHDKIDYERTKKFLDVWGYLNDEELNKFQENFL